MSNDIDKLEKLLSELKGVTREAKGVTREARECLKDFSQMKREYAAISSNIEEKVNEVIGDSVKEGLNSYQEALEKAIELASAKVFARFDKLSAILMGEDKKHLQSIPSLIEKKFNTKVE